MLVVGEMVIRNHLKHVDGVDDGDGGSGARPRQNLHASVPAYHGEHRQVRGRGGA